jgi:hypothetical protein
MHLQVYINVESGFLRAVAEINVSNATMSDCDMKDDGTLLILFL